MKQELEKIKRLSEEREDENWAFRATLKATDIPSKEIDQEVFILFQKYSNEIDCTQCGNCCREITPILKDHDVKRLAVALNISPSEVQNKYLRIDDDGDLIFNTKPCPFLSDNKCRIYEHRPEDCRSYPHLDKGEFIFKTIQAIENCFICPIVFYVFEDLKAQFRDILEDNIWL